MKHAAFAVVLLLAAGGDGLEITDLAIVDPAATSLVLTWTAPTDPANEEHGGVVGDYEVRFTNSPTAAWSEMTVLGYEGQETGLAWESAVSPGLPMHWTVGSLKPATYYRFRVACL